MSVPPSGRRPNDVPAIRDSIVHDLHGAVGRAMQKLEDLAERTHIPAPTSAAVELRGLDEAKLFWVPPDETQVISEAATELPEDLVLEESMIPSPSGFVVFGGDWYGTDAATGLKTMFPIRAYRWGPVTLPNTYDEGGWGVLDGDALSGIAISAYSYTPDMDQVLQDRYSIEDLLTAMDRTDDMLSQFSNHFVLPSKPKLDIVKNRSHQVVSQYFGDGIYWVPLGRSDWVMGEPWRHHAIAKPESIAYPSLIEDRCIMAALWALMGACAPQDWVPDRAERRRAARRGHQAPPVRIVSWRGPQGQRVALADEVEGNRHVSVRYVVRPHWRHARVGPGRMGRRWVYIPRHWRGPEDAPLSSPHETIHKIVRQ